MSDVRIHLKRRIPAPKIRPTRQSALLLWLIALAGLLVSALLALLINPAQDGLNVHLQLLITNLLYYMLFAVLPVFLLAKRTPGLYEAYRPNPISFFDTVTIAVLAVLGVFFVNDITVLWCIPLQKLGFDVFTTSLPVASSTGELMLSVITIAVLPAISEEFLFRGAVLSAFESEGTKRAMWMSSLMFMLMHGSIAGAPTQIILGMLLAYLVIWTNSIYAGLIYHTVHNATSVILEFIQNRMPADAAAQTGDLLTAIGGLSGVLVLVFGILLSAALMGIMLRMLRLRGLIKGVGVDAPAPKPLRRSEWLILFCGLAVCAVFYINDIVSMLGG